MTATMPIETQTRVEGSVSAPAGAHRPVAFKNVLVGVDGTSTGRDAIALAEMLRHPDGRMTLAHVVLVRTPVYRNFHSTPAGKKARDLLERERTATGVSGEFAGMFASSVGSGLDQLAEDCDADLIVVGSSGRALIGRVLVGAGARGTVSGAACPVAVAPHDYAGRSQEIRIIGVAYNGTVEADAALAVARDLSPSAGSRVRALDVVRRVPLGVRHWRELDAIRGQEKAARDRLRLLDGVEGRVVVGVAAKELAAFSGEVDVLVVGSRGHGPVRRLIRGSTSMQLIRLARCPLLVVPRAAVVDEVADTD